MISLTLFETKVLRRFKSRMDDRGRSPFDMRELAWFCMNTESRVAEALNTLREHCLIRLHDDRGLLEVEVVES